MLRSLPLVVLLVAVGRVAAASQSIAGIVVSVDAENKAVEVRQLKSDRISRLRPRPDAKIRFGSKDLQLESIPVGSRAVILVDDGGTYFRQMLITDPNTKAEKDVAEPPPTPVRPVQRAPKTTVRTTARTEPPKLPRLDPPQMSFGTRLAPGDYTTHVGPRGGVFHYSASGKKVYHKK
jgi:hypothetical protein